MEGVIKFNLNYTKEPCVTPGMTSELSGWRFIMHRLQLIGQDQARYMGYGFGNLSRRCADEPQYFIITGTQTGGELFLAHTAYSKVTACDPYENSITASGMSKPSSEALTHGQLYQLDDTIQSVLHVHSPRIWNLRDQLGLPITSEGAAYGTVEMALEVTRIFAELSGWRQKCFIMGGHEDGVVSFGTSVREACETMIAVLAEAVALGGR